MTARPADAHARLAQALQRKPFTDAERARLRERLSLEAGAGRIVGALRHGRPASADSFLAAHAVKGWDPLTSRAADPHMPPAGGPVMWNMLALALRLSRLMTGGEEMGYREAAKLARVPLVTWCRAENAQPVGVVNLLRLCAFLDRHPNDFCTPERPCFTANMQWNTLKSHTLSPADQPAA